jgi:hypothetical protein
MTNDPLYEEAKERVEEVKGFYIHLAIYVTVNLGLFIINAVQGDAWWFYWATIGWGIGVLSHAVAVFFGSGNWVKRWEARKIERYIHNSRGSGPDTSR